MKKTPTIHITTENLAVILDSLGIPHAYQVSGKVLSIAHQQGLQIRNRSLIVGKSGTKKKIERIAKVDNTTVADSFQSILLLKRRQAKHRHITTIGKTDKDYTMLKSVATIAEEFCDSFGYKDRMLGYGKFCDIGLSLMGKLYGINKFKYHAERIFHIEECLTALKHDTNEEGTSSLYEYWKVALLKYAGLERHISSSSLEYVHFLYARQEADTAKAKYKDWIDAQFEGLAFMGVVPELSQLYSGQSTQRYEAYKASKSISKHTSKKEAELDDFDSEMDAYFAKLEAK